MNFEIYSINRENCKFLKKLSGGVDILLVGMTELTVFTSFVWSIYERQCVQRYGIHMTEDEKTLMILEDLYYFNMCPSAFIAAVHDNRIVGTSRLVKKIPNVRYPVENLLGIEDIHTYLIEMGFGPFKHLYDNGRWASDSDYLLEKGTDCPELFPEIFKFSYSVLQKENSVIFGELDVSAYWSLRLRKYPVAKTGKRVFTLGSDVFPVILPRDETMLNQIPSEYENLLGI